MALYLQLTEPDGDHVYVNMDMIESMKRIDEETRLYGPSYHNGEPEFTTYRVTEQPVEIILALTAVQRGGS